MGDGAHLNIGAERAMKTIVDGKEQPPAMTDEEFEAMVRNAPISGELSYESASSAAARIVLEAYEEYPQLRELSDECVYLRDSNGNIEWGNEGGKMIHLNVTLYDVIKKLHKEGTAERDVLVDLTGFMWGWAMNAARKILGLGPVPNPAMWTICAGGSKE